jgi:hypothetical protein
MYYYIITIVNVKEKDEENQQEDKIFLINVYKITKVS